MIAETGIGERLGVHQQVANKLDNADYDEQRMLPAFQRVRSEDLSEGTAEIVTGVIDWYRNFLLGFPSDLSREHYSQLREAEQFYEDFFYTIVYGAKRLSLVEGS